MFAMLRHKKCVEGVVGRIGMWRIMEREHNRIWGVDGMGRAAGRDTQYDGTHHRAEGTTGQDAPRDRRIRTEHTTHNRMGPTTGRDPPQDRRHHRRKAPRVGMHNRLECSVSACGHSQGSQ